MRLSQDMDSMMSMVHTQINRARSSAISERVNPEINCPQDTGTPSPVRHQTIRTMAIGQLGLKQKFKKRTVGLPLIKTGSSCRSFH